MVPWDDAAARPDHDSEWLLMNHGYQTEAALGLLRSSNLIGTPSSSMICSAVRSTG